MITVFIVEQPVQFGEVAPLEPGLEVRPRGETAVGVQVLARQPRLALGPEP